MKWIHVTALDVLPQKELYTPDYTVYHNLSTISSELAKIVASNPQYVRHFKEYTSRQGRLQHVIHVSNFLMQKDEEKVKILFSFGEHAREFFPIESLFFLLYQLLRQFSEEEFQNHQKSSGREILDLIDLYVIVIGNPDGRSYVEQSENFCWRGMSNGVDINRNFGWEFGDKGSSRNRKDEEYRGAHAFSEPETQVYRELTERLQFDAFVSFHSGIRQIYIPYADTKSKETKREPSNVLEMLKLAQLLATVTRRQYRYGKAVDLNDYTADGTVFDYMAGVRKIPFSYAIELWGPDNHKGASCFDLFNPSNHELQETLEEVSQVYSAFFQYLVNWKQRKSKFNTSNDTADIMNPEEILYISHAEDYQSADVNGEIPTSTPGLVLLLILIIMLLLFTIHGKFPVFRRIYHRRRVISLKSLGSSFKSSMFSP